LAQFDAECARGSFAQFNQEVNHVAEREGRVRKKIELTDEMAQTLATSVAETKTTFSLARGVSLAVLDLAMVKVAGSHYVGTPPHAFVLSVNGVVVRTIDETSPSSDGGYTTDTQIELNQYLNPGNNSIRIDGASTAWTLFGLFGAALICSFALTTDGIVSASQKWDASAVQQTTLNFSATLLIVFNKS
jgi:hypothetical protein